MCISNKHRQRVIIKKSIYWREKIHEPQVWMLMYVHKRFSQRRMDVHLCLARLTPLCCKYPFYYHLWTYSSTLCHFRTYKFTIDRNIGRCLCRKKYRNDTVFFFFLAHSTAGIKNSLPDRLIYRLQIREITFLNLCRL